MARGEASGKTPTRGGPPEAFIRRSAGLIAPGGPVLDVAAGAGRHSALFLDLGHPVTALDINLAPLAWLMGRAGLKAVESDLETAPWPCPGHRFAAVVVVNYLWRPLFPALLRAVAPGGLLLYDTFAAGNERFGRPANPAFLLQPGELRERVGRAFTILTFEESEEFEPRPAVRQRIAARRL